RARRPTGLAAAAPGSTRSGRDARAAPCRRSPAVGPGLALVTGLVRPGRRHDVLRHLDGGAVLPEPLERVELAVLVVLHVDDDVAVVEQHPARLRHTLLAEGLDALVVHRLVDGVDDRA